jgi:hypothetical protein
MGSTVSWQSSGWNPGESVGIVIFNPNTGQYLSGWSAGTSGPVVADSNGNAQGSFIVSTMAAAKASGGKPLQIYAEDGTTPFPHVGYQTNRVAFTVTGFSLTGGIGEWIFPSSWDAYFTDADLLKWQKKFDFNTIRLAMDVEQLAGIPPWTSQFPEYDSAVAASSKYGYYVVLTDFTFTGSPPSSDMSDWLAAWKIVAQHYSGDSRIAVFEVANELEHSTTTNQVLSNVVTEIRAIDSSRLLAIWQYSPSKPDGTSSWPQCPSSFGLDLPSGIYTAYHPSTYNLDQYRHFSSCKTNNEVYDWYEGWIHFAENCGFSPLVCEINAQAYQCNSTTEYLLTQGLIRHGIAYACWGWTAYKNNWNAILGTI